MLAGGALMCDSALRPRVAGRLLAHVLVVSCCRLQLWRRDDLLTQLDRDRNRRNGLVGRSQPRKPTSGYEGDPIRSRDYVKVSADRQTDRRTSESKGKSDRCERERERKGHSQCVCVP